MKVFVYGHYDSRGGTTAIEADTRWEADAAYLEMIGYDEEWGVGPETLTGDFLWETNLIGADALGWVRDTRGNLIDTGQDLEGNDMGSVWVMGRYYDDDLGFIKEGEVPTCLLYLHQPYEEGITIKIDGEEWVHPQWDDDAYSFVLLRRSQ